MKIAVFGDVSADFGSLCRLFSQTRGLVDKYVCLGDILEYNFLLGRYPTHNCVDLLRNYNAQVVRGNHDTSVSGNRRYVRNQAFSEEIARYLAGLPEQIVLPEAPQIMFTHKSPTGRFTLFKGHADREFQHMERAGIRVAFFGHSHKRLHFKKQDEVEADYVLGKKHLGVTRDASVGLHLINPGTVDGAPFPYGFFEGPSYCLYDTSANTFSFESIEA